MDDRNRLVFSGNANRPLAKAVCDELGIRMGKALFYEQLELNLADAYACASETMACNLDSEDAREGIDAFIAKRKPQWKGC